MVFHISVGFILSFFIKLMKKDSALSESGG